MRKMVKFKLSRECREIAVNPDKVLYVSHYDHGATCVHFSKECFVRVKGDLDEVMLQIEGALGDDAPPAGARSLDDKRTESVAN